MARVLVVEDSPEQARLIAGLLRSGEFTTDIADSGEQAIEMMEREAPDLVVTDLMLPGVNGLEVVEWVVSHHPLIPVILMTAFGSGEIATQALQKGAASYVPKRMLHEDLISTVEDTLGLAEERREQAQLLPFLEGSEHHFVLENDPGLIPPLAAFLREGVRNCSVEFDDTELMQVGIALHEAVVNAIHHGNFEVDSELREGGGDAYGAMIEQRGNEAPYRDRRVHVTLKISRREITCVIRDEGPGFDRTLVPDPTDEENLERVSGRGLYLIWTFMDHVEHNEAGNRITLIKRAGSSDGGPA